MESFASRLTVMRDMFPTVLIYHNKKKAALANSNGFEENFRELQAIEGFIDVGTVQPIRTTIKAMENSPEIVKGKNESVRN
jgi:transformation/transcription domain-associated protein